LINPDRGNAIRISSNFLTYGSPAVFLHQLALLFETHRRMAIEVQVLLCLYLDEGTRMERVILAYRTRAL